LVNLDLVRCIRTKLCGEKAEIKFVYANGDEDVLVVSLGRLEVLYDCFHDLEVLA
jgi:hypothetical protein